MRLDLLMLMKKNWGPVYWNVFLYRRAMQVLRPGGRKDVFSMVADKIGNMSVLELCPGEGSFKKYLHGNEYASIDKNPVFVAHLQANNVPATLGDVRHMIWPPMESLVMTDSLYHFMDDLEGLMKKAREHPFKKIIFSESIRNVASGWFSPFAVWATRVDGISYPDRFTSATLRAFFKKHGFQSVIEKGPYLMGVWERL